MWLCHQRWPLENYGKIWLSRWVLHHQWRSQPDNLVLLCKFEIIIIIHFFKNWLFSQSMNTHSGIKSSGWLRYWSPWSDRRWREFPTAFRHKWSKTGMCPTSNLFSMLFTAMFADEFSEGDPRIKLKYIPNRGRLFKSRLTLTQD